MARSLLKQSTSAAWLKLKEPEKAGGLNTKGFEIMTYIKRNSAHRALNFLVLIALVAGSVLPAFSQTRRVRRSPRLGRYTRPVAAQPTYRTVSANTLIRVRMN